jgi:RNA recognition motif-containing protein
MDNEIDAKSAFTQMAYFHLRNQPLYLEWAPFDVFDKEHRSRIEIQKKQIDGDSGIKSDAEKLGESHDHKPNKDELDQQGRTKILARNVPFQATQREIKQLFSAFGEIKFIRMPKKVQKCRHTSY